MFVIFDCSQYNAEIYMHQSHENGNHIMAETNTILHNQIVWVTGISNVDKIRALYFLLSYFLLRLQKILKTIKST